MKNWIIGIIALVVLVWGGYMIFSSTSKATEVTTEEQAMTSAETQAQEATTTVGDGPYPSSENEAQGSSKIGKSAGGSAIYLEHFGTSVDRILFVGGIHGGYAANTFELAGKIADYFKTNIDSIPKNLRIDVVMLLNPDGFENTYPNFAKLPNSSPSIAKLESGRYNANKVDLNRNFDCEWQATGVWQNKKVSGGSAPFSEPESMAIKNYIEKNRPKAVIVYYSAAGGVYSSSCGGGILPETAVLTSLYAKASGYPAYDKFDAYPISGDMVNWLAKEKIPAISVLLTNHTDVEFDKNLAGVKAVLARYAK